MRLLAFPLTMALLAVPAAAGAAPNVRLLTGGRTVPDRLTITDVRHAAAAYGRRDLRNRVALRFSLSRCHTGPRRKHGSCRLHEDAVDVGYGIDPAWSCEYRVVVSLDGPFYVTVVGELWDEAPLRVRRPRHGQHTRLR